MADVKRPTLEEWAARLRAAEQRGYARGLHDGKRAAKLIEEFARSIDADGVEGRKP